MTRIIPPELDSWESRRSCEVHPETRKTFTSVSLFCRRWADGAERTQGVQLASYGSALRESSSSGSFSKDLILILTLDVHWVWVRGNEP